MSNVIAQMIKLVARKMTPAEYQLDRPIEISLVLLPVRAFMFGIGWIVLGISLGFVLKSLEADFSTLDHFLTVVAAAAVATSIGFLALSHREVWEFVKVC
ncbi:MAG: hypothetical protein R3C11_14945 [Planctomycetaceae bacterium]